MLIIIQCVGVAPRAYPYLTGATTGGWLLSFVETLPLQNATYRLSASVLAYLAAGAAVLLLGAAAGELGVTPGELLGAGAGLAAAIFLI